jgi:thiol-disulfide isomerase/thioredoxin
MMKTLFLLIALSVFPPLALATPGEIPEGGVLRNVPMQGLTGPGQMLSDFRGKPLIINVWASYCPPCLAEMGSLERLSKRYGKRFNVIGISIDDYPERARGFLAKTKTSFPHFIDQKLTLENMLGGNRVPLTVVVDAQGRVQKKVFGAQEWDSPESVRLIAGSLGFKP